MQVRTQSGKQKHLFQKVKSKLAEREQKIESKRELYSLGQILVLGKKVYYCPLDSNGIILEVNRKIKNMG